MVDIYVGPENTHWILHEKLLCHRSKHFRQIFYGNTSQNKNKTPSRKTSTYGLPDDDDEPFRLFVGWLYSSHVPPASEEADLGRLFDLYLMGEKWEIRQLKLDVLEQVRKFYHDTDTWPGLRRVQYVYANTEPESPLRQLLVQSIARMLVLGEGMPPHWDKALRKNGQLAVDIILCVQQWHFEGDTIPDARSESVVPVFEEGEHQKSVRKEEGRQQGSSGEDETEADLTQTQIKQEPGTEEEVNGTSTDHVDV